MAKGGMEIMLRSIIGNETVDQMQDMVKAGVLQRIVEFADGIERQNKLLEEINVTLKKLVEGDTEQYESISQWSFRQSRQDPGEHVYPTEPGPDPQPSSHNGDARDVAIG